MNSNKIKDFNSYFTIFEAENMENKKLPVETDSKSKQPLTALLLHVERTIRKPNQQGYIAELDSVDFVPNYGSFADGRKLN